MLSLLHINRGQCARAQYCGVFSGAQLYRNETPRDVLTQSFKMYLIASARGWLEPIGERLSFDWHNSPRYCTSYHTLCFRHANSRTLATSATRAPEPSTDGVGASRTVGNCLPGTSWNAHSRSVLSRTFCWFGVRGILLP